MGLCDGVPYDLSYLNQQACPLSSTREGRIGTVKAWRDVWDVCRIQHPLSRPSPLPPCTPPPTQCPPDSRSTQDFQGSYGLEAKLQHTGTLGCEFMPSALEAFLIPHHHLRRKEGGSVDIKVL